MTARRSVVGHRKLALTTARRSVRRLVVAGLVVYEDLCHVYRREQLASCLHVDGAAVIVALTRVDGVVRDPEFTTVRADCDVDHLVAFLEVPAIF